MDNEWCSYKKNPRHKTNKIHLTNIYINKIITYMYDEKKCENKEIYEKPISRNISIYV